MCVHMTRVMARPHYVHIFPYVRVYSKEVLVHYAHNQVIVLTTLGFSFNYPSEVGFVSIGLVYFLF